MKINNNLNETILQRMIRLKEEFFDAIINNDVRKVSIFLQEKEVSIPDEMDGYEGTAFEIACKKGYIDVVKKLRPHLSKKRFRFSEFEGAIQITLSSEQLEVAEYLINTVPNLIDNKDPKKKYCL